MSSSSANARTPATPWAKAGFVAVAEPIARHATRRATGTDGSDLSGRLALQHLAEQLEVLAREAGQLHLADRMEVGRAGVDLDTRQQPRNFHVMQVGGLLHDVAAGEVGAALLQLLPQ